MKLRHVILSLIAATTLSAAAVEITATDAVDALDALDRTLRGRDSFISLRQERIDMLLDSMHRTGITEPLLLNIVGEFTGFNNDSALHYLGIGLSSPSCPDKTPFALRQAMLLPLGGFFSPALEIYNSIDTTALSPRLMSMYYDCGRQMYSYMSAFAARDPEFKAMYTRSALERQRRLLETLPRESLEYKFNLGEYYFLTGSPGKSRALLEEVLQKAPEGSPMLARAAHHLSAMAKSEGDENAYTYYLAISALADVRAATREMASLQELGNNLYEKGEIRRAYAYLNDALASAVECGAPLRMIETSRSLPIIERAYNEELDSSRRTIYVILFVLVVAVVGLIITMATLYKKMRHLKELQQRLQQANRIKEVYISQFLNLCSIYMDKLNQFCKIVSRKITAGKVDDLYKLTKSGKFVEEQSKEFYDVFDNAFLHLYPDFVEQVNMLLKDGEKIKLKEGELLNTDLRILAFMRLGIEESPRIAQVLNYSLNTIYAYRNRTKARAINRDTFEAEIMKIKSDN